MKLFRKLDSFDPPLRGGALTIGNFDGVHQGHAKIIKQLKQLAAALDGPAIVFTFDPHPVRLLRPEQAPPPLTWTNRKADLLAELGVDVVVAFPTDQELLSLTHQQFFDQIIVDKIGAKALVEGPNFFYGKGREGTTETLARACQGAEIEFRVVSPVVNSDEFVSSSRIRNLIRNGEVGAARDFLTQPYRIRGMVTHGASRGSKIGFPTANLDAIDTLIPAKGVYAGRTFIDNRPHWSAVHIGPNPTFGDELLKVESHILDFEASIYGQPVEVDFMERLRDIRQFDSAEELKSQLIRDVERTRKIARKM